MACIVLYPTKEFFPRSVQENANENAQGGHTRKGETLCVFITENGVVMGGAEERGLDPTLVGFYHGRQLEGSRKGAAKSKTTFVSDVYSGHDRLI